MTQPNDCASSRGEARRPEATRPCACGADALAAATGDHLRSDNAYREDKRQDLWNGLYPLFRFSPRTLFNFRNAMLRLLGARVGHSVRVYNSVVIRAPWNLEIGDWSAIGEQACLCSANRIAIGARATISQRAHLCASDESRSGEEYPSAGQPIRIGDQAWVCADAFVGPGVSIGVGAVVGARAVVVADVEPWNLVVGNPARRIRKRALGADLPTAGALSSGPFG